MNEILICKEGCDLCRKVRKSVYPNMEYIEIPKISIGLGDTIAKITSFFGITPCAGCRLRQIWCNKWFPYPWNRRKVPPGILAIKEKVYRLGVRRFPVVVDREYTKIIQTFK